MSKVKAALLGLLVLIGANVAVAADTTDQSRVHNDYSQVDNYNP